MQEEQREAGDNRAIALALAGTLSSTDAILLLRQPLSRYSKSFAGPCLRCLITNYRLQFPSQTAA